MINYKIDVLKELKDAGYSTYKIQQENIFSQSTLQWLRDGRIVGPDILNKICNILNKSPGDILEWFPDDGGY